MTAPDRFTTQTLDWVPWLAPMAEEDLTDRHYAGLVQRPRARNPYFRLLADEPDVLGARTRADLEIFHNTADGLPRAERELAATVASRVNGCIYCASVHSAFAAHFSKRPDAIQRLLDDGVDADRGRAGMPWWLRLRPSPRPRRRSGPSMSVGFARPGTTRWPCWISSTRRPSSGGRTG